MAWTTKKGFNFRATAAYVSDNADEIGVYDTGSGNCAPSYPSSRTLDGDTFNIGWTVGGGSDGSRDRDSGVDRRCAGLQDNRNATSTFTFRINAGTAAGTYRIWMAITDQGNGTSGTVTYALRDSNGTLFSRSALTALTSTQVYDAAGNVYATAASWAAAAGGAGAYVDVVTTDTTNGSGGPILYIDLGTASANAPLAHFAIQYMGAGGSSPVLREFLLVGVG